MINQEIHPQLQKACAVLRAAIFARSGGDLQKLERPFHAISGLECAALNAPHNRGWLRQRTIELREALDGFCASAHTPASTDQLSFLYNNVLLTLP